MQRVDGYYLYQIGSQIHPLTEFKYEAPGAPGSGTTRGQAFLPVVIAFSSLEPFLTRSVFKLRTSANAGQALFTALRRLRDQLQTSSLAGEDQNVALEWIDVYSITSAAGTFETVLNAELALIPLYLVTQKAGFDTAILVEHGEQCFPAEMATKAPDALPDLQQATRCIAFDLPTAAAFHLHRANESVLRLYWDAITNGAERPADRSMGTYINEMNQRGLGEDVVKSALRDLKNMHRNPLIHPEHSLESADQAIALMNAVHNVIVQMLRAIPGQVAVVPVGGATVPSVTSASAP